MRWCSYPGWCSRFQLDPQALPLCLHRSIEASHTRRLACPPAAMADPSPGRTDDRLVAIVCRHDIWMPLAVYSGQYGKRAFEVVVHFIVVLAANPDVRRVHEDIRPG